MSHSQVGALSNGTISLPVRARISAGVFLSILALLLVWLELINHLRAEWTINPQYNYGWSVPFLAAYLFWKRWQLRPAPASTDSRTLAISLMVVCAALILPLRVVAEANPDWRLLSWTWAIVTVALFSGAIFLAGGKSWLGHFAFPILFFLVAVPWPVVFEQPLVQGLMSVVAQINVSLLNIFDVPAVVHGNVIEVSTGLIGIEEACSGVRSLQATFMVALFLGEFYEFSLRRRTLLILLGAVLAFICNLVRTMLLVFISAREGANALERWHDPAGFTILFVCLFALWGCSLFMLKNSAEQQTVREISPVRSNPAWPWQTLIAVGAWIVIVEASAEFWYRAHQHSSPVTGHWTVQWPSNEDDYKPVPIAPESRNLLRYNEGGGGGWRGAGAHTWNMFFFRWLPGRTAALFVRTHRPDICLPASGMIMRDDHGLQLVSVNSVTLPMRSYRFDDRGTPLHVFYCYWDGRSSYGGEAAAQEDWSAWGRLRAAWKGQREIGTQMLELAVWGYEDDDEARAAILQELKKIIRAG